MLMTVHSAKGLEFSNVYLVGMEQGVFPGMRSMDAKDDVEEERRLAYVALTRAKKHLTISTTSSRMLFGMTMRNLDCGGEEAVSVWTKSGFQSTRTGAVHVPAKTDDSPEIGEIQSVWNNRSSGW